MKTNRGLILRGAFCFVCILFFCGTSTASDTIIFDSTNTTASFNYFRTSFPGTGCNATTSPASWSIAKDNVAIMVTVKDTSAWTTGGTSYIEIYLFRLAQLGTPKMQFSDGLLGFAVPEELDVNYNNIRIHFTESNMTISDVTNSYNQCTQTIKTTVMDGILGNLPKGYGLAYSLVSGFVTIDQACSDPDTPFYGSYPFLNKNGWDQSLVLYEEPGYDDYSGIYLRMTIPIAGKTRSEVLGILHTKPMAIHGNIKARIWDTCACALPTQSPSTCQTPYGSIEFTKTIGY